MCYMHLCNGVEDGKCLLIELTKILPIFGLLLHCRLNEMFRSLRLLFLKFFLGFDCKFAIIIAASFQCVVTQGCSRQKGVLVGS